MTPQKRHHRVLVRCAFLGLAVFCAAQYAVLRILSEPYPALLMPGFAGSGGYHDGEVSIRRMLAVCVPSEGKPVIFSQREFLSDYPDSLHGAIADNFLAPLPGQQDFTPTPSNRTGARHRVFPGLAAGSMDRTTPYNIASFTTWLEERVHKLLPGTTIGRVEFRWFEDTFSHKDGTLAMKRKPAGTFVVRLGGTSP